MQIDLGIRLTRCRRNRKQGVHLRVQLELAVRGVEADLVQLPLGRAEGDRVLGRGQQLFEVQVVGRRQSVLLTVVQQNVYAVTTHINSLIYLNAN